MVCGHGSRQRDDLRAGVGRGAEPSVIAAQADAADDGDGSGKWGLLGLLGLAGLAGLAGLKRRDRNDDLYRQTGGSQSTRL